MNNYDEDDWCKHWYEEYLRIFEGQREDSEPILTFEEWKKIYIETEYEDD